jgi:hypothetical protein
VLLKICLRQPQFWYRATAQYVLAASLSLESAATWAWVAHAGPKVAPIE